MRHFLRSCLPLALALTATSCSDPVACPTSVDDYCANSDAPECRYRDFEEALWEWNQQAEALRPGSGWVGCDQCGDYDILRVGEASRQLTTSRYFSRATGELVAILERPDQAALGCVAGPPIFTLPSCGGTTGRCGYATPPDGAIDGP